MNLIVDGNRDRQELKQWFDELWGNDELVKDVKQEVLNYLKQLYENNAPEFIYYKTLCHIFEKFLGDIGKTDADLGKTSLLRQTSGRRSTSSRRTAPRAPSTKSSGTTAAS